MAGYTLTRELTHNQRVEIINMDGVFSVRRNGIDLTARFACADDAVHWALWLRSDGRPVEPAGSFRVPETDKFFWYGDREPGGEYPDFPHVLITNHGYRYARILKTVAYIVVDEDENGPVTERWNITKNKYWGTK